MKDLKQRIIPAIIAIALVLFLTKWVWGLAIILIICCSGSFWEMRTLCLKIDQKYSQTYNFLLTGGWIYCLYTIVHFAFPNLFNNVAYTPTYPWAEWIYVLGLLLLAVPNGFRATLPVIGGIYPLLGCISIVQLCFLKTVYDLEPLLLLMVCVWAADGMAYFGGSLMKGKKLAPSISPGKTISGWISALFGVLIVTSLYGIYQVSWTWVEIFWFAMIVWLSSTLGDLFESKIKRLAEVKDSGKFLPGHGGYLDRLDSIIYAAPFALHVFKSI